MPTPLDAILPRMAQRLRFALRRCHACRIVHKCLTDGKVYCISIIYDTLFLLLDIFWMSGERTCANDDEAVMKFKQKLRPLLVDAFHKLYYGSKRQTRHNTFWLGVPCFKCPLDLWIYQEIIFEVRPDIIIEAGTASGGSALFLACVCDWIGSGSIVSIDIQERADLPKHNRINYLVGSSVSDPIVQQVSRFVADKHSVLVVLDSDHSREHVLEELRIYSRFVTLNSYVIVEDTNLNGHPIKPAFGPGPMEAVVEFLQQTDRFAIDADREKFFLTFNPKGYLKRVR